MKSEKLHLKITYRGWVTEALVYNDRKDLDYFKPILLKDANGMAKTWLSHGLFFRRTPYLQSYLYMKRFNNVRKNQKNRLKENNRQYKRLHNEEVFN